VDAGWVYFLKGRLDKAREVYQKAVEKDWMTFIAHYSWGFLELSCEHADTARDHFEQTVAALKDVDYSDRENVQIEGYYAMALAALGETEEARRVLDDILTDDNLIGDVYYNVARTWALLGEESEAVGYLHLALSHSPGPTESEIALDPHFKELDLSFIGRTAVA
jgi:tetratricopeptide (TPR) repeat protein